MIPVAVVLLFAADVDRLDVGPLRVEISRPSKEIGLDDPLRLDVTVQHPPHVTVEPPKLSTGTMLDSALVIGMRVDGPDPIPGPFGPLQVQNWSIVLEPTKVGSLKLGKLQTRYQEKGKPIASAEIPLPSFDVKPGKINLPPDAKLKLPPLPDVPEPAPQSNAAWWLKVVGGGLLAVCMLALAMTALKPKSPTDEARAAILAAKGTPRQAISQICDAIRAYLQKAHAVSAAHLTTPELLADDESLAALPASTRAALAELLPLADMLRFPQPEPTDADLERCRAVALRAVESPKT